MNDKELLKLAAKAAGVEGTHETRLICNDMHHGRVTAIFLGDDDYFYWNPLTDDGDALRLAVKLHISVFNNEITSWASWGKNQIVQAEENHYGDDPYEATRRAIVRAAAEIGKNLG